MKSILYRMLASIVFIFISVWLLLALLIYFFQASLIYFPSYSLDSTPAEIGLPYEDVRLNVTEDIAIHGWYVPHDEPRATLLFLHGNGGNISHRLESIRIFNDLSLSVFIIDYEGYGESDGRPSEQATYRDAAAAWNYLVEEKSIPENQIVIFGRSLGGAVAIWLANRKQAAALILESTFTSIVDMGRHYYPYLPVNMLTRFRYASNRIIADINSPVLFIHSREDDIVPFQLGEKLYTLANEPKTLMTISGGHNDGFLLNRLQYIEGLEQFLDETLSLD